MEDKESYTKEEVFELIKKANLEGQQYQAHWNFFDQGARECLLHLKPLCNATKENPLTVFDPQVYAIMDELFARERNRILGIEPEQPAPAPDEVQPE